MDRPAFRTWIRLALPLALGLIGNTPAAQAQTTTEFRSFYFPGILCQPEEDEMDLRRDGVRITNNSTSARNRIKCPVAWPLETDVPLGHVTLTEVQVGYIDDNGTPNLDGELSCRLVRRSEFGSLSFNALQFACASVPEGGCNTDHGDRGMGFLTLPFSSWELFDGTMQNLAVTCSLPKKWVVSGAGTFFSGLQYYRATFRFTK